MTIFVFQVPIPFSCQKIFQRLELSPKETQHFNFKCTSKNGQSLIGPVLHASYACKRLSLDTFSETMTSSFISFLIYAADIEANNRSRA